MRTIEKGILAIGILSVMLVIATGSASATDITECTVIGSPGYYEITEDITNSTATYCIDIQADNVILDGQGHWIDGVSPGDCVPPRAGIYNYKHDNVVIKNVEVKNFCYGIQFKGYYVDDWDYDYVVNNTIDNCKVHDNGNPVSGATMGIELFAASHCDVTNNEVYNNTGGGTGCGRGGMGIRMHGTDHSSVWAGYHTVTNNEVYGNRIAGIYSKKKSMHNYVADNDVYENGEVVSGDYFGGGIRLQCKKTNGWTVEHNDVMDNYGPGIYVRGDTNVIRYNGVRNSKNASDVASGPKVGVGYGIYFSGDADNSIITENVFCDNEGMDIRNDGVGTTGDENCCDTTRNYDDEETTGCTYCCGPDLVITDIWIESGKSCTDGKEIEEKELEEFMQEKGMEKEQKELKQLIDELGISMEESGEKCIGRKVYYEIANMGCEEWAGWSVSNLSVDGEFKMFDIVRPLAPKQSRVERFWFYRLPSGEHEVEVCADFLGWVSECNETNNCLTKTLGG